VRYFLARALEVAAPPYSRTFAAAVARLMRDAGAPMDCPHLAEFVQACAAPDAFSPPLPPPDAAALKALHDQLL